MTELWKSFSWVIPILALLTFLLLIFIYIWKQQSGKIRWADLIPIVFTTVSVGGIFLITLSAIAPGVPLDGTTNLIPFSNLKLNLIYRNHLDVPIRNLLANIALFIPFGFFISWLIRTKKWMMVKATLFGSLLSLTIEILQFYLPLGRSTDIDDWLMNTVGAFIGAFFFLLFIKSYKLYKLNSKYMNR